MPDKDLPLKGVPGKAVLAVVDKAVETRWDDALRAAREAPGATPDARSAAIATQFTRQLAGLGAAAGGTAALPGVGTIAAIGTTTAELAAFAFRASEMVMAIGAAQGHTSATEEQRRAWVLSVLAFGDDAAQGYSTIVSSLGGAKALAAAQGSAGWFHTVNRYLGRKLIARFGAREGAAALGRLLPFGIGAAFGGGTNWFMARAIAKDAARLFRQLPADLVALPPPPPRPAGLPA